MDGKNLKKIVELRHELHAHPELAMHEGWTKRRLMDFIGANTTLAVVDCGGWFYASRYREGTPAVAFRADMDALPVEERNELPFRSTVPGRAHVCGHDIHTACLLGAAELLQGMRDSFSGTVKLIFQPGEEGPDGAAEMIAEASS